MKLIEAIQECLDAATAEDGHMEAASTAVIHLHQVFTKLTPKQVHEVMEAESTMAEIDRWGAAEAYVKQHDITATNGQCIRLCKDLKVSVLQDIHDELQA
jgi:hypothetical protein